MPQQDLARSRIMLDLLESVDRDSEQSQRNMAVRFGVALGLVNAYLRICIKKGYVKVRRMPARRRAYLLTPKGLAEKSRLTVLLLSNQLELFRRARADYADVFAAARAKGWRRVVLIGASELADISVICAREADVEIIALIDPAFARDRYVGAPVTRDLRAVSSVFDGALITDVRAPRETFVQAVGLLGADRVLAPALLGVAPPQRTAAN
jgi:DNA-binding MarR family transcriptional regulator